MEITNLEINVTPTEVVNKCVLCMILMKIIQLFLDKPYRVNTDYHLLCSMKVIRNCRRAQTTCTAILSSHLSTYLKNLPSRPYYLKAAHMTYDMRVCLVIFSQEHISLGRLLLKKWKRTCASLDGDMLVAYTTGKPWVNQI